MIFYISSWFSDKESFAKRWSDSAARDIPVQLYGGVSADASYWKITGGKQQCLGGSCKDNEAIYKGFRSSADFVMPAELRKRKNK